LHLKKFFAQSIDSESGSQNPPFSKNQVVDFGTGGFANPPFFHSEVLQKSIISVILRYFFSGKKLL